MNNIELKLKDIQIITSRQELERLPKVKLLINTINAHSYNTAEKDSLFAEALMKGDVLIPDGASIVMACRWLKAKCTRHSVNLCSAKIMYRGL